MRNPRRRSTASFVVRVVKGVLLGTLMAVILVTGMRGATASSGASPTAGSRPESLDEAYSRVVARAMSDQQCSYARPTGPGPASALIRTVAGDVQVVSFEYGWDVYNGRQPGSLIAVCLEDQPASGQTLLKVAPRA